MAYDLKNYEEVKDRLPKFYIKYPDGRIITKIVEKSDNLDLVVFEAAVYKDAKEQFQGLPLATGYAFEIKGQGGMANKFSHIENSETSAIGRALANIGLHGDKRPSREEMDKVQRMENETESIPEQVSNNKSYDNKISDKQQKRLFAITISKKVPKEVVKEIIYRVGGVESSSDINWKDYNKIVDAVEAWKE